ncbi:MAG TPA: aminotransferase class I/II-fold pyridoxal phosphate-dependent enzyme [Longimicrobiales bacterium]
MRPRPFELERFLAEHEFRAPHMICGSDCESVSIGELLALEPGALEGLHRVRLGYTESHGAPELRSEIAALYATTCADDVLVHAGAQEAIFGFMNAVLEPGDHVVAHWPAYASLHEVARAIGCEVTPWRADEANGWALDPDDLRRALQPNTKAVVVNFPHNPTGALMDRDTFSEVVAVAAEHGAIVFSDEVYRGLEHRPEERLPAACDVDPRAVSLGVLSKTYGLPGLRIGWVATRNRPVLDAMAAFKDYTSICNAAPSEYLACVALRQRDALVRRNLEIIRRNVALAATFIERHADRFEWTPPRAGSVAFPALRDGGSERFCLDVLDRAGVLLLPSRYFGAGDRHFRLGLGRVGLEAGLERLDAFLTGAGG